MTNITTTLSSHVSAKLSSCMQQFDFLEARCSWCDFTKHTEVKATSPWTSYRVVARISSRSIYTFTAQIFAKLSSCMLWPYFHHTCLWIYLHHACCFDIFITHVVSIPSSRMLGPYLYHACCGHTFITHVASIPSSGMVFPYLHHACCGHTYITHVVALLFSRIPVVAITFNHAFPVIGSHWCW